MGEAPVILAGDIGGTKTDLALYAGGPNGAAGALLEQRYENRRFGSLEAMLAAFLDRTETRPAVAVFGVAGPVTGRKVQLTNLSWTVRADALETAFNIPRVALLNDLQALAHAVPHLKPRALCTLHAGRPAARGPIVVIAPGTGLGTAFLLWTGRRYAAWASEGGHAAFSPRTAQQAALLGRLTDRFGHVSFERFCSGSNLPTLYDMLLESGAHTEPAWLAKALSQATDRTPVIVRAALEKRAGACEAALDLFVQALGTFTGNLAVTLLPTGGIYLAGGMPARLLPRLQQPDFLQAVFDKGRFSALCKAMPVHVIVQDNAALRGAAWYGVALRQSG